MGYGSYLIIFDINSNNFYLCQTGCGIFRKVSENWVIKPGQVIARPIESSSGNRQFTFEIWLNTDIHVITLRRWPGCAESSREHLQHWKTETRINIINVPVWRRYRFRYLNPVSVLRILTSHWYLWPIMLSQDDPPASLQWGPFEVTSISYRLTLRF